VARLLGRQRLQEIGIGGFTELRMLLHFDVSGRTTSDLGDDVFLDAMHLKHVVDGREITLYNAVDHKKPPPADCPYCGQPLRTAKAKQCRACGTDWHDPENIVRRSK
jgi:hypothetical protein